MRSYTLRFAGIAAAVVATIGCGLLVVPSLDELTGPANVPLSVSDGANNDGNRHFFFLPPMVPEPQSYGGAFDGTVEPVVQIVELTDPQAGDTADEPLAVFTTDGNGSGVVRVDEEDEHYVVNWHIKWFEINVRTYRIRVLLEGVELGFADVYLGDRGSDQAPAELGEFISVKNGRTLPIKFRIEEGVLNDPPVAAFNAAAVAGAARTIAFDASGSRDPDGDPSTFSWDFESDGAPDATGRQATHQYPAAGTYDVTLVVEDGRGGSGSITQPIAINDPAADLVIASYTIAPASPKESDTVSFRVLIENTGDAAATFPGGYGGLSGSMGFGYGTLGGLTIPAGGSHEALLTWQPFSHAPGSYTFTVTVDPDNRIVESNDENNSIEIPVTLAAETEFADLVVSSVELTIPSPTTASDFRFLITVTNQGTRSASITYPNLVVSSPQAYYVYPPYQGTWTLAAGSSQTFEVQPNWGYITVGTHDWSFTVDPANRVHESDETNNVTTITVTVTEPEPPSGPVADLVIASYTIAPASPKESDTVSFRVLIENTGDAAATFPGGYGGLSGSMGFGYGTLGGLTIPAGGSHEALLTWQPFSHAPGSYTFTVTVDPDNRIVESNDENNSIEIPVTLAAETEFADLVVSSVELTIPSPTTASDFRFLITVTNQGTRSASITYPNLVVSSSQAYYVYPPYQGTWTLAAGSSQTFEVQPNWGYITVGTHDWSFTVDPANRVHESDETNNVTTITVTVTEP